MAGNSQELPHIEYWFLPLLSAGMVMHYRARDKGKDRISHGRLLEAKNNGVLRFFDLVEEKEVSMITNAIVDFPLMRRVSMRKVMRDIAQYVLSTQRPISSKRISKISRCKDVQLITKCFIDAGFLSFVKKDVYDLTFSPIYKRNPMILVPDSKKQIKVIPRTKKERASGVARKR